MASGALRFAVEPESTMIRRCWDPSWALPAMLAVALAIRLWVVFTQSYTLFYDETIQYLEQAHRLVFGAGVLPWEFQDGIRSWLLPGVVGGVFWLTDQITSDPLTMVRVVCVVASLAVVFVGYRWALRAVGPGAALLTGGLCAMWFDLVWFAPAVMTEVLAAHSALLAVCLGQGRGQAAAAIHQDAWYAGADDARLHRPSRASGERVSPADATPALPVSQTILRQAGETARQDARRSVLAGVLFGLAFCLRFQYAPALAVTALWQYRLRWSDWGYLITGALAVILPVAGLLDWITWGSPFQSIWLNVVRNFLQGVSAGMGTKAASYFLSYLSVALWPLPVLALFAVLGAWRAPALGLMALATLLLHSAVPHKEVRFIYLALAIAPILIGLGISSLARCWAPLALVPLVGVSLYLATGPLAERWQFQRAVTQAFLAAHDAPNLCGLAVRDMRFYQSGGYAWLHRNVPLYLEDFRPAVTVTRASVALRLQVILRGQSVPQFPGPALAQATAHYSHMIAEPGHAPPGFAEVACFSDAIRSMPICLFSRPGVCS